MVPDSPADVLGSHALGLRDLKKAAELASDHRAGITALAEVLKLSAAQVHHLVDDADQCPVLHRVGGGD